MSGAANLRSLNLLLPPNGEVYLGRHNRKKYLRQPTEVIGHSWIKYGIGKLYDTCKESIKSIDRVPSAHNGSSLRWGMHSSLMLS